MPAEDHVDKSMGERTSRTTAPVVMPMTATVSISDSVSPVPVVPVGTRADLTPPTERGADISSVSRLPRRSDPALNRDANDAHASGIPFTAIFDPVGQPVDDAVRLSTLIGAFQDQFIPIRAVSSKAKMPIIRNGEPVPTSSSRRYDVY